MEIIKKENQIKDATEKNKYKSYIDTIFQNGTREEIENLLNNFNNFSNNNLAKQKNTINTRKRLRANPSQQSKSSSRKGRKNGSYMTVKSSSSNSNSSQYELSAPKLNRIESEKNKVVSNPTYMAMHSFAEPGAIPQNGQIPVPAPRPPKQPTATIINNIGEYAGAFNYKNRRARQSSDIASARRKQQQ